MISCFMGVVNAYFDFAAYLSAVKVSFYKNKL